jgi:Golgi phosphoprotein 3
MLTFAEEFLLLAHDEDSGDFAEIGFPVMSSVLAGAALMDLALLGRIDSDPRHHLILVDSKPVDEPILDFCLARIAEARHPNPSRTGSPPWRSMAPGCGA